MIDVFAVVCDVLAEVVNVFGDEGGRGGAGGKEEGDRNCLQGL